MLVAGASILKRSIVRAVRSALIQQQPCGVDLTLSRIFRFTSAATIDYDNRERRAAKTEEVPFRDDAIVLRSGVYLVEFNEHVKMPLDCAGALMSRSTLWRSGVTIEAGVIDAGYEGALGALLNVRNEGGVELRKHARLAQMIIHAMQEEVGGYHGIYQNATDTAGRDGTGKTDGKPE